MHHDHDDCKGGAGGSGGDACCHESGRGGPGTGFGSSQQSSGGEGDQDCPQDHLDYTAGLWDKAFWQALHEVRVDLLKSKIKSSWGKNMEETAAAVVDTMHKEWKEAKKKEEEEEEEEKPKKTPRLELKERLKKGMKKGPQ